MKKIILIALSVVALTFSSCADFLNTSTEGAPTLDSYFTNDDQAVKAVLALYSRMSQEAVYGRNIFWEQAAANDIVYGRSTDYDANLALLNAGGDESALRSIYGYVHQWVASAQWIIQELEAKKADQGLSAIETRSLGEAYFLRGLWHFIGAYRHGTHNLGFPYKPWEEYEEGYNNQVPPQLASVAENFAYIVSDMEKAEALLPWSGSIEATYGAEDRGRAHKASACAYLAKVNAYWATFDDSRWDKVIEAVNRLETTYGRGLNPSFSQLWSSEFADFWNKECCYSIPSNGGANGGPIEFGGIIVENGGWGKFNGWGQMKPTLEIYNEMAKDNNQGVDENGKEIKNERLAKSILEVGDWFTYFGEYRQFYQASDHAAGFAINKYMDALKHEDPEGMGYLVPNSNWPCTRVNFHILRFADCLLLRAEAYLNKGNEAGARADINRVRERVALTPITTATWEALYHERRCELAFEMADHLYDLKRWAHSSYGVAEIAAIAKAELERQPMTRVHADRMDPNCTDFVDQVYVNCKGTKSWTDNKIGFKYPSAEITKAGGLYKQIEY